MQFVMTVVVLERIDLKIIFRDIVNRLVCNNYEFGDQIIFVDQ